MTEKKEEINTIDKGIDFSVGLIIKGNNVGTSKYLKRLSMSQIALLIVNLDLLKEEYFNIFKKLNDENKKVITK